MDTRLLTFAGGCLIGLAGCHSSPHYGGQQYYGTPSFNSPSSGYVQPGTTYGSPGGTYAPPGGMYVPQNNGTYVPEGNVPNSGPTLLTPTPSNPTNAPTWQPDPNSRSMPSNNPTPTFNNSQPPFGSDRTVPNPMDAPFDVSPGANKNPFPKTGLNRPNDPFPPASSPVTLESPIEASRNTPVMAAQGGNPTTMRPTSDSRALAGTSGEPTRPNPYDFERKNYAWLRGVVDYDATDQSWHIIYNLTPGPDDELGGSISLIVDPQKISLQDRSIIQVEGAVDPNLRDKSGKPMYRVTAVHPMSARGA